MAALPSIESMVQCPICIEPIFKRVQCMYCQYVACRSCVQRYLTDENTGDPQCMNCHKPWSTDFIYTTFTKSFYWGDLKKHREETLLQRERGLLPATMAIVEFQILREKEIAKLIAELNFIKNKIKEINERLI